MPERTDKERRKAEYTQFLLEALEAAEKDSKRLDWLKAMTLKGDWPMLFVHEINRRFVFSFMPRQEDRVWCDTLEDAIDVAMSAEERGGE